MNNVRSGLIFYGWLECIEKALNEAAFFDLFKELRKFGF